jgi:hypothetical protein
MVGPEIKDEEDMIYWQIVDPLDQKRKVKANSPKIVNKVNKFTDRNGIPHYTSELVES